MKEKEETIEEIISGKLERVETYFKQKNIKVPEECLPWLIKISQYTAEQMLNYLISDILDMNNFVRKTTLAVSHVTIPLISNLIEKMDNVFFPSMAILCSLLVIILQVNRTNIVQNKISQILVGSKKKEEEALKFFRKKRLKTRFITGYLFWFNLSLIFSVLSVFSYAGII